MTAARCSVAEAAEIARVAMEWLGTPYRHQASCRGAGADCLGLVRGVWREVVGREPETPPPYTPDWSEASREERLMAAADRNLTRIAPGEAGPGDVLLFRMRARGPAKHCGILVAGGFAAGSGAEPRMVHAYSGRGVVLSSVGPSWRRRIAAAYRFPEAG